MNIPWAFCSLTNFQHVKYHFKFSFYFPVTFKHPPWNRTHGECPTNLAPETRNRNCQCAYLIWVLVSHNLTFSFQTPYLLQLPCCLDRSTRTTLYPSLTWASWRLRWKYNSSKKTIWRSSQCKEGDAWWRRECIERKWKFHCLVKLWPTCAKRWTLQLVQSIHVSHSV